MVDVDTRKRRPLGRSCKSLDTYSQNVELLLLATRREYRAPLGPRLVAAPPAKSAQRILAMRLSRGTEVDKIGDPVDLESIASVNGANNLVQGFRRSLRTHIISHVEECMDKYRLYGGIGRSALSRRPGQTVSQWVEMEEDLYQELLKFQS